MCSSSWASEPISCLSALRLLEFFLFRQATIKAITVTITIITDGMPTKSHTSTLSDSASPCFPCSVDAVPFSAIDSATKTVWKLYLTVIKITDLSIVFTAAFRHK